MKKYLPGEKWKPVHFGFRFTNEFKLEVSNFGRLRTFHKTSEGDIINGSMINGYRIIRLKLFKPRDKPTQAKFDQMQQQVSRLMQKIKTQKLKGESKKAIKENTDALNLLKKKLSEKYKADLRSRTINYHSLIHRLVAENFIKKPSAKHSLVAHLDYNKLNNKASNLKWMTPEENYKHQKGSPSVIKEKEKRRLGLYENTKVAKLNAAKVSQLKKLLNLGKPMKQLVKQFKVTDTQILRIKRGENWAYVKAAK